MPISRSRCESEILKLVVHIEGREEMIAQVSIQPLAAYRLDGLADEVDIDAVFPACAGIGCERQF
jgi:hypothetical protein